ncbi:MAG: hypothetical protein JWP02_1569, partial [Acidimicrobiales bacterium]|nr:hypothetical protein [Acidimicrobiales bacterium]
CMVQSSQEIVIGGMCSAMSAA